MRQIGVRLEAFNVSSREYLENYQIWIYFTVIIIAIPFGLYLPPLAKLLGHLLTGVLAILMFSMMTQIPFTTLKYSLSNKHFIVVICLINFIIVPIIVWFLSLFLPTDSAVLLGFYLVLLTPCIDYVVVFTALGKGDAQMMLAITPLLFIMQLILLPFYLWLFLGQSAASIVEIKPFIQSFFTLILIPLLLAFSLQFFAKKSKFAQKTLNFSAWLPVFFMAFTLFIVIASQINQLAKQLDIIMAVIPLYIAFMVIMPFISKWLSKAFRLTKTLSRTIVFSSSTRNSLVVLTLASSLPSNIASIVIVVIVTQTIVELIGEVFYIHIIPRWLIPD